MGITYGDHLIDIGYYDITPEQERGNDMAHRLIYKGYPINHEPEEGAEGYYWRYGGYGTVADIEREIDDWLADAAAIAPVPCDTPSLPAPWWEQR